MKRRVLPLLGLAFVGLAAWISSFQREHAIARPPAERRGDAHLVPVVPVPMVDRVQAAPASEPPAAPVKRERYSKYRDASPIDEIDFAVGLSDEERTIVAGLVIEREAQMHEAYAEIVADGRDRRDGINAVTEIYDLFHARIRAALRPDQQAKLDEGRRAGTIGKPMFIFVYGSQDPTHP